MVLCQLYAHPGYHRYRELTQHVGYPIHRHERAPEWHQGSGMATTVEMCHQYNEIGMVC